MIVFDLDGTLVDSAPEIIVAMEQAWAAVMTGLPFPRARFRIGPPLLPSIAALDPSLANDDPRCDAIAAEFRVRYDASDFSATRPYPGVDAVTIALAELGIALGIATNKRKPPTLAILARWFPGRFPRVACIDGVSPEEAKAPDHVTSVPGTKQAMLAWHQRARPGERLVMVGDTVADLTAARAVGARAVGVTWGYDETRALAAAGPDALAADATELEAALIRLA